MRETLRTARHLWRLGPGAARSLGGLGWRVATERNQGLSAWIVAEVGSWPGVTRHRHRFGGVELRLGKRELGHIHANHLVDLPFPVAVRKTLVAENRALRHHILPDSGWVSFELRGHNDVAGAVELFRLAYERSLAAQARRGRSDGTALATRRRNDGPATMTGVGATADHDESFDR